MSSPKHVVANLFAILLMTLMASTVVATNAQAAKPSPEYINQLGKVYSGIRSAKDQRDICKTMFPQQHASYDNAWKHWEVRNQLLVTEFDRRYDRYLRDLAPHNTAMLKQYKMIMENKFSESKVALARSLQHAGTAKAQQICQSYPASLEGAADPGRVFAREIADSRHLVPAI